VHFPKIKSESREKKERVHFLSVYQTHSLASGYKNQPLVHILLLLEPSFSMSSPSSSLQGRQVKMEMSRERFGGVGENLAVEEWAKCALAERNAPCQFIFDLSNLPVAPVLDYSRPSLEGGAECINYIIQ